MASDDTEQLEMRPILSKLICDIIHFNIYLGEHYR